MFSKLHERLGTAGLAVAVVALVAALAGTAYAAGGGLNTTQKKEVKKIAKQYAGKKGATGPAGPAGQAGPKGDVGAAGANGKDGATGATGATGKEGKAGKEGSPWTAGGVLPSESTETGTWGGAVGKTSYSENEEGKLESTPGGAAAFLPVSIPIPLEAAPEPILVKPGEEEVAGCPGVNGEGVPQAEAGKLCVYASTFLGGFNNVGFFDPTKQFAPGSTPTGTVLGYQCTSAECFTYGTWAVTAE